jgi:hypothetical protein
MSALDRKRAADMARELRRGAVTFATFVMEFGGSPDDLISDLLDLLEHEPQRGGLLGASEDAYAKYETNIERAIRALEGA